MAIGDGVDSSGKPCTLENLQIIQAAKAKFWATVASVKAAYQKVKKTIEDVRWGKVGDELAAIAIAQAGAIAAVAEAAAASAIGALAAAAFEELFKYILYLITLGPDVLLSVMKKPLDRALNYSQQEVVYLNEAQNNFSRIMAVMSSMSSFSLLPDYTEKMRDSLAKIKLAMKSFSALVRELDNNKYFRKSKYEQGLQDLQNAITAIKTTSPLSDALSTELENKRSQMTAVNQAAKNAKIQANEDGYDATISNAGIVYHNSITNITSFYSTIILAYYSSLLKEKGYTQDLAGAGQYIAYLTSIPKASRSNEVTNFNASAVVNAAISIATSSQSKASAAVGSAANSIYTVGYANGGSSPSGTLGLRFSKDLSGCVNAINDAENTKVASISTAGTVLSAQNDAANLVYQARNGRDTLYSIGSTFNANGLKQALGSAYGNKWSLNLQMLGEEFSTMASNVLTAFMYYKKRQACTKGCAFALTELEKAFDLLNQFVSKISGFSASSTSTYIKKILSTMVYDNNISLINPTNLYPGTFTGTPGNLMEDDLTDPSISDVKITSDANISYAKLLAAQTLLQSYITPSLIDIINSANQFSKTEELVLDIIQEISRIPDWDGGSDNIGPDAKTADSNAAWIYSDLKKNIPDSPYVALSASITTLSLTAPIQILQGGKAAKNVRGKMQDINILFHKLLNHNAFSTDILNQLKIPYNPYAEVAMAQLDKYGMDMLMDLFEAASFSVMAKNIIVGKLDYLTAQLNCSKALQDSATSPAAKKTTDTAAAQSQAQQAAAKNADVTNRSNADAPTVEVVIAPNPGFASCTFDFYTNGNRDSIPSIDSHDGY